ncbi:tlde1 domain-containing protein, partial [Rosenbergiella epipactidis]
NGVSRGGFRLHPLRPDGSGLSEGCITFLKRNDFYKVRKNLIHRKKVRVPNSNSGLMAYGYVDVQGKSDFDKCKIS